MTGRDRIVVIVIAVVAILGAGWVLVVSPERKKADKVASQVATAQSQLATAQGQLAGARQDQAQYQAAYSSIVSLGKAVPPSEEVPSLIYQLERASNQKSVDFSSIVSGASGSASSASSASATPGSAPTGFTQMPFTFVFNGSFFDLDHLFQQLDSFTQRSAAGALEVDGRLLTIQSVKLAPATNGGLGGGSSEALTGTIAATAYVLPASQGLTGASPAGGASPASGSASPSSPTTPAIVRANP
jgi:Tfp pilus assembly protein PilO